MSRVRGAYPWADATACPIVVAPGNEATWWTFGGYRANATLSRLLLAHGARVIAVDNFAVTFGPVEIAEALAGATPLTAATAYAPTAVKFAACLPADLLASLTAARQTDTPHAREVIQRARPVVSG